MTYKEPATNSKHRVTFLLMLMARAQTVGIGSIKIIKSVSAFIIPCTMNNSDVSRHFAIGLLVISQAASTGIQEKIIMNTTGRVLIETSISATHQAASANFVPVFTIRRYRNSSESLIRPIEST